MRLAGLGLAASQPANGGYGFVGGVDLGPGVAGLFNQKPVQRRSGIGQEPACKRSHACAGVGCQVGQLCGEALQDGLRGRFRLAFSRFGL